MVARCNDNVSMPSSRSTESTQTTGASLEDRRDAIFIARSAPTRDANGIN